MIELCEHYMTTGHPRFLPRCEVGRRANLKCHSKRLECPDYQPSEEVRSAIPPTDIKH